MIKADIRIDLKNGEKLKKLLEFILSWPCISKEKEEYDQIESLDAENKKYKDTIKELNIEIDLHIDENKKNQDSVSDKDRKISELNKEIEKCKQEKKQLENEIQQNFCTYKKNIEELNKEITKLKEMLENYPVSYGTDNPSDKLFFEVTDNKILEQSMISKNSLYYAQKNGELYELAINTEYPMKKAISNCDYYISPFCDIQVEMSEANTISIKSFGKANLIGSQLKVIEKPKVSLIKR